MASVRKFPWSTVGPVVATAIIHVAHGVVREARPAGHPLRLALTVALALSVAFTIRVMAREMITEDEFHRRVQASAVTFAFPASMIAAFLVGLFMNEVGVHWADLHDLPSVMLVTYLLGYVSAWRSLAASK